MFMPAPLDILLDPISLSLLGMYALLMLWEAIFPVVNYQWLNTGS